MRKARRFAKTPAAAVASHRVSQRFRSLNRRSVAVLLPLAIVTVFCFTYATVKARSNCARQASAAAQSPFKPAASVVPLQSAQQNVNSLQVIGPPANAPTNISDTVMSDVVSSSYNPNEASTRPLQAPSASSGNKNQSVGSGVQPAPGLLKINLSNL